MSRVPSSLRRPRPFGQLATALVGGDGRVVRGKGRTDANPPCYHTVGDDLSIVDFPKLDQQILTATALTEDLVSTDDVPEYDPGAPAAGYEDAESMLNIVTQAEPDFSRFSAADEAASQQFLVDIGAVVDAGPEAFDDAAVATLLEGSVGLVSALATGECDGFLG